MHRPGTELAISRSLVRRPTTTLPRHLPTQADSTSSIFGIGKKSAFQKLVKSDPVMKFGASAFILQNKSQDDISDLGKDLIFDVFSGKSKNDTLSSLRHIIFTKKVATAKAFVTLN